MVAPGATIDIEQPVAKDDNDDNKNLVFTAFEAGTSNVALVNDERELSVAVNDIKDGSPLQLSIKPSNIFFYYFSSYKAFSIFLFQRETFADRKMYFSVTRCYRRYCDQKMLEFFVFF